MALGHTRGYVSEAQLRKNFKMGRVFFTAIALLFSFFAWGEIDKAYFGRVYDARVEKKWESGGGKTSYVIRYSYMENGVKHSSTDNVDAKKYERFAAPTTATSAPTGKVKVGKALGFYFDEYFEGEFQPEVWMVRAIATAAVLANLLAVYFWVRPLFGRLAEPVEAPGRPIVGASQIGKASNPGNEPNYNILVALVRSKGPFLNIVFVLGLFLFSWLPAILIWSTLMTVDAVYCGKTYDATIVRKYSSESTSSSKSRTKYNIEYSYEAGGRSHGGHREVSGTQYDNVIVPAKMIYGQPLTVRVSQRLGRDWPEMLLPGETKRDGVFKDLHYIIIGCAIFLIPDAALIWVWRHLRRARQHHLKSQSEGPTPAE